MKIKIVNESSNPIPEYAYDGDAGMDLRADVDNINPDLMFDCQLFNGGVIVKPGGRLLIPTGIHIQLPKGYEGQVRPRSGLTLKSGVEAKIGTIDSNYRGDIGIIFYNHSKFPFTIEQGDRIAQLVINKVEKVEFEIVEDLNETDRNEAGFGSSNVN